MMNLDYLDLYLNNLWCFSAIIVCLYYVRLARAEARWSMSWVLMYGISMAWLGVAMVRAYWLPWYGYPLMTGRLDRSLFYSDVMNGLLHLDVVLLKGGMIASLIGAFLHLNISLTVGAMRRAAVMTFGVLLLAALPSLLVSLL